MKVLVLSLCCLVGVAAAQNPCPQAKEPKTEQGLLDAENRWVKALDSRDAAAVGCMLDDRYKDTGALGEFRDKQTVIEDLSKGHHADQHVQDMDALLVGDVGVIRGLNHLTMNSNPFVELRFTDVFVYKEGHWKALSSQETVMQASRPKWGEKSTFTPGAGAQVPADNSTGKPQQ
jgi:hypothetical protein